MNLTAEQIIERVVLDDLHGDASGFNAANVADALREAGYLPRKMLDVTMHLQECQGCRERQ